MKMVSIKCPNCGSSVELNEDLEKGTCNYCGTEIYNENALEKKKVEVSGSIVVNGVDITKELENALNFYKSGCIMDAINRYNYILSYDPFNEEALYNLICCETKLYSFNQLYKRRTTIFEQINKLKTVAEDEEIKEAILKYEESFRNKVDSKEGNRFIGCFIVILLFAILFGIFSLISSLIYS